VDGQFGENFTIEGLADDTVCIGDRFQIGSAFIRSHPTSCYLLSRRHSDERPRMPALLTSSSRPGFYFRVLQEGEVGAGDEIVKVGEAKERMTHSPRSMRCFIRQIMHGSVAASIAYRSAFTPGGAHRSRHYCRVMKRPPTGVVTAGLRAGCSLRIRLRLDFDRSR